MPLILRNTKGEKLTHNELDGDFIELENRINTKVNSSAGHGLIKTTDYINFINLYNSSTSSAPVSGNTDFAFDGNRAITRQIAGLQGVVPGSTSGAGFLEAVFYPAVAPTASLSIANAAKELGDPATSVTISWTATKQTNPITAIVVDGQSQTVTGNTQSGSTSGAIAGVAKTFNMSVTAGALTTTASASVSYTPAYYFGANSSNHAEMVASLTNGTNIVYTAYSFTKELSNTATKNFNSDCTGGKYIHVLYRAALGLPESVTSGGFAFSAYTTSTINIKDIFGVIRSYILLSSDIQNGSSVNLNLTNNA